MGELSERERCAELLIERLDTLASEAEACAPRLARELRLCARKEREAIEARREGRYPDPTTLERGWCVTEGAGAGRLPGFAEHGHG